MNDLIEVVNEATAETTAETRDSQKKVISENQCTPIIKVINAYNLDLLQARYPKPSYTICENYKKGNSPHGRLGLDEVDEEQCRNLHPKKCFRWIKAGNHKDHGCTKGRDCEFYHPVLCKNSVRYRRCMNQTCTFTHLRFTKRHNRGKEINLSEEDRQIPYPWSSEEHTHRSATNEYERRQHTNNTPQINSRSQDPWYEDTPVQTKNHPAENQPNLSFLVELIESMKRDMKSVNSEMQIFKTSITDQVSSLHPQIKQQMDSMSQELQEMKDVKRNLMNNQQFYQQFQQLPQAQGMQTNPTIQTHQTHLLQHPHPHHQWGITQ